MRRGKIPGGSEITENERKKRLHCIVFYFFLFYISRRVHVLFVDDVFLLHVPILFCFAVLYLPFTQSYLY